MRRRKHKHVRRAMAFYRLHFGFREPFKVLLDGNFVHATLASGLTNLQGLLDDLLGGACKLFTSRCVGPELRSLGADFAPALAAARAHALHHCGHEPPRESASDCIEEQVGAANSGRWVVATQDKRLQAALARVPGAPVVFASVNGLHLSDPSELARSLVAGGAAAAQALPAHERESAALRDLPELRPRDEGYKKFRRKHAKGPNPLAVKKKQPKDKQRQKDKQQQQEDKPAAAAAAAAVAAKQQGGSGGGGEGAEAKKKRKRKKGGKGAAAAAAAAGGGGESS